MKWLTWFKQKFAANKPTVVQQSAPEPVISITIVPALPKTDAPVVESEIVFNKMEGAAPLSQHHCFPELTLVHTEYVAWKEKVQQIMRENKSCDYNPAAVGTLLMSAIEQWLHSDGKALMHFDEYGELMSAHTRFHRCAGSILVKHQRGEFLDAVNMLRCDFKQRADEVEQALANLLHRAQQDYCNQSCNHCHADEKIITH